MHKNRSIRRKRPDSDLENDACQRPIKKQKTSDIPSLNKLRTNIFRKYKNHDLAIEECKSEKASTSKSPTKSYNYVLMSLDKIPLYVGKATNDRPFDHLIESFFLIELEKMNVKITGLSEKLTTLIRGKRSNSDSEDDDAACQRPTKKQKTSCEFWGAAPYKRSFFGYCPSARKVEVVYKNCIERFNLTTDNALTADPKYVFDTDGTECSKCISIHKNKSRRRRSNSDSEDDLIKLRTIDRRFKVICDQFRIKELCLHDDSNLYINESYKSWFYTHDFLNFNKGIISESWFHRHPLDDTIIYFKKINVSAFYKFTNHKLFHLFNKLRRLALCVDYFNFSVLNHFEFLEQLKIATHLVSDYVISLEHLKIIQIDILVDNGRKLNLNTPKLSFFNSVRSNLGYIEISFPEKILFYETNRVFVEYIENFKNLEYLKLNNLKRFDIDISKRQIN